MASKFKKMFLYAVCLEYAHSLSALTQYGESSAFTSMTTGLATQEKNQCIPVGPPYPYWQGSHLVGEGLAVGVWKLVYRFICCGEVFTAHWAAGEVF